MTLEVRYLGAGVFALYTYAKSLNNNMSLDKIKETLVKGIINDLCSESLQCDCTPTVARELLTNVILDKIPEKLATLLEMIL